MCQGQVPGSPRVNGPQKSENSGASSPDFGACNTWLLISSLTRETKQLHERQGNQNRDASLLCAKLSVSVFMAILSSTQQSTSLPKRTRINVRQSKYGCLTCRARKVKCDETKPICLRCVRAYKQCDGYRERRGAKHHQYDPCSSDVDTSSGRFDSSTCTTLGISPINPNDLRRSSQVSSYTRLGLEILLQQRLENVRWTEQPSWIRLISQLLVDNDAVGSAIIYLGAAFEAHCLPTASTGPRLNLAHNQKALTALLREVDNPSQGFKPVFLASIILAATEALRRHLANALIHVRGAFRALTFATMASTRSSYLLTESSDLRAFATSLDLQTSWYALSEPPQLESSYHPTMDPISAAKSNILPLLHSCYHFTNRASKFKYRRSAETPSSILLEQGRYIAALRDWLATSDHCAIGSVELVRKRMIQRVQGLSTLIYVSTILSSYEVAYDQYLTQFQQIIDISKKAIALSKDIFSNSSLLHFKTQPDLFQAVYFTAVKCRNPFLRRQAVGLFSHFGIEGPWDARVMTRIAQRVIEIEETLQLVEQCDVPIPETQRLHGVGVDSSLPSEKTFPTFIQTHFSLCKNVVHMVNSGSPEESEQWIMWTEDLEVGEFCCKPVLEQTL